jgi:hypothetical protein
LIDDGVERSPAIASMCSLPSGPNAFSFLPRSISASAVRSPASSARGSSEPSQPLYLPRGDPMPPRWSTGIEL